MDKAALLNRKKRHPIAITRPMIEAGLGVLDVMTREDAEPTDEQLVAEIFFKMWAAYWDEIDETARKRLAPRLALMQKPKLILPTGMN